MRATQKEEKRKTFWRLALRRRLGSGSLCRVLSRAAALSPPWLPATTVALTTPLQSLVLPRGTGVTHPEKHRAVARRESSCFSGSGQL